MPLLRPIRPPVFEIGLKGYSWGADALRLALEADRAADELGVAVVFDPQTVDIPAIVAATRHIHVWAQHMDPFRPGRGVGGVLAEALRDAGATGTLLSHSEKRMSLEDIAAAIVRARETGLGTMVFADSPEEAAELAGLGPDIVLAEPPSLIATGQAVGGQMADFVTRTVELVASVDPRIIVMSGAGVTTADDVATVMRLGLGGTGSSSGILKAPDPVVAMWAMLEATSRAWAELHPTS